MHTVFTSKVTVRSWLSFLKVLYFLHWSLRHLQQLEKAGSRGCCLENQHRDSFVAEGTLDTGYLIFWLGCLKQIFSSSQQKRSCCKNLRVFRPVPKYQVSTLRRGVYFSSQAGFCIPRPASIQISDPYATHACYHSITSVPLTELNSSILSFLIRFEHDSLSLTALLPVVVQTFEDQIWNWIRWYCSPNRAATIRFFARQQDNLTASRSSNGFSHHKRPSLWLGYRSLWIRSAIDR